MFITVKKWTIVYTLCLIIVLFSFIVILQQGEAVQTSQVSFPRDQGITLIIDPGHGGEDGGAVASDGTIESHINLAIALKAAEIARFLNWNSCMTRSDDISIHSLDAKTLRQKKVSDLKNRAELCNSINNGVLVSFHQNSLPGSPNVQGAQVFYNENQGSEALAQAIQNALNCSLNTNHPKEVKSIGENSYLMKHANCPAVLVECGFLSNAEETKLLNTDEYQKRLASVVITAVISHLSQEAN